MGSRRWIAYWGGERHGGTSRDSPGKTPFAAAAAAVQCSCEGHPIAVRMDPVNGFRKNILADWEQQFLTPGTAVVSDGLNCFSGVMAANCNHVAIPTGGRASDRAYPIFQWVNTMLGNVKKALHGTYHCSAASLPATLSL